MTLHERQERQQIVHSVSTTTGRRGRGSRNGCGLRRTLYGVAATTATTTATSRLCGNLGNGGDLRCSARWGRLRHGHRHAGFRAANAHRAIISR